MNSDMSKNKLTYVFGHGRVEKIINNNYEAKEFFYSYFYFDELSKKIEIVEMLPEKESVHGSKLILRFIDKVLRKISNLPFYFCEILSIKNFKTIFNSEKVLITNDRLAISLLPIIIFCKLFSKTEFYVIIMGLYGKNRDNRFVRIIQKLIISLLENQVNKLVFLGKGELDYAKIVSKNKQKSKFIFLPFSVDYEFWNEERFNNENSNQILFIGNDGNRDYDFVQEVAKELPQFTFLFISKNIDENSLSNNSQLVKGSWNNYELTDLELKQIYKDSFAVILPLKDSYQPSGQSVSLQAMASGVPVIISKTKGFWDNKNFKNQKHIIFCKDNNISEWKKAIINLNQDKVLYKTISENSKKLVAEFYNLEVFHKKLLDILNINENF